MGVLKIEMDEKNPNATRIIDIDTGAELHGIRKVVIVQDAGGDDTPHLTLEIELFRVAARGDGRWLMIYPPSGDLREVKSVQYADGSSWVAK